MTLQSVYSMLLPNTHQRTLLRNFGMSKPWGSLNKITVQTKPSWNNTSILVHYVSQVDHTPNASQIIHLCRPSTLHEGLQTTNIKHNMYVLADCNINTQAESNPIPVCNLQWLIRNGVDLLRRFNN